MLTGPLVSEWCVSQCLREYEDICVWWPPCKGDHYWLADANWQLTKVNWWLHLTINDSKGSHKRRIGSAILLDAGCKNLETDLQLHASSCTGIKSWDTVTLNMFIYIFFLLFKSVALNFSIQGQFWQMPGVEKFALVSLHHCSLNDCLGDLNQGIELWRVKWSASGAMCCTMFAQLNESMMTVGWQCVPLRRESTVAAGKTDFRAFEIVQWNVCCLLLVAFVWKFHLAKFTWKVWSCSCSTKSHS